jgi:hypothetical protein
MLIPNVSILLSAWTVLQETSPLLLLGMAVQNQTLWFHFPQSEWFNSL